METFLTKAMTIVVLTCFLVVGAAATAILGRDSIPAPRLELASASVSAAQGPVSNREVKQDRLAFLDEFRCLLVRGSTGVPRQPPHHPKGDPSAYDQ